MGKPLNIFILSVGERIYSTNRIYQEAIKQGHNVRIINHTKCSIKLSGGNREIIYKGENIINQPDVIIPRIGASVTRHGAAVVKEFEMNGIFSTARSLGIIRSQNKVRTLQIMNRKGIPIPDTLFSVDTDNIKEQIELLGGAPVVIKLQEGTQGVGVMLAESKQSAKSIIDTMYSMKNSILLQEFIKESNSEDFRAFVVGNKILSAMQRKGLDDDFRSNIHLGGSGSVAVLTEQEQKMAIKAAKYLGLPIAGVDIIRSKRGPLLIEVNSTPGLQGIEAYTKVNIAEGIINYVVNKCSKKNLKTK
ncbi:MULTISPECIES: RimK family alpha-L-glutamate ligase [Tenacibaculum]|uniref:RimK family alpha-L-glutamate ligase n=1 Tax=Tenacibaculum TaxID=104267 RepID=UPI001F0ABD6D|nr:MULTISPECIES: RimK family alpha-L-glutamate ligase [Tenacibaculum]MCH3881421.1 RimK family alpha-L-glutamate ligase [Tenacibaculum aquimarinum]MCH3883710.1 RimK family alpha-L-glutamate ligase [Tenacibaculum aquimarinum]MDO6598985.1 RimK family alpha-L-glutamate ligase [Tenacibaculum sp. 1_MG-2023]